MYKEVDLTQQKDQNRLASWSQSTAILKIRCRLFNVDDVTNPPTTVFQTKTDPEKPNPRMGVGLVEYSCTGHLLATRNDNQPTTLWIWSIVDLKQVALLQQAEPIRSMAWNPVYPDRLAMCCGNGVIYLWDKSFGCDAIQVPAGLCINLVNFQVLSFQWNPDGKSLLLMDKDKFCVSFLIDE